ncbi:hypothetical protein DYB28_000329 [Aphanomyces astaci]|uniref:Ferric oxidoreductase domain-containing protein n=1 Tax=Aphanomyces astaci TaxID=112090 RepID=A0A9X8DMB0_APHAT|nr:hypothetical protein DYB28_000329 [Aphanomyces astaci]
MHVGIIVAYYANIDSLVTLLPCWDCDLASAEGTDRWQNVFGFLAFICVGVVALTSLPYVRRNHYEVFRTAHFLFVPAAIFASMHRVPILYSVFASLVLYLINHMYSRETTRAPISVARATAMPADVIELTFHTTTHYAPGGTVWVRVPALSHSKWHPFHCFATWFCNAAAIFAADVRYGSEPPSYLENICINRYKSSLQTMLQCNCINRKKSSLSSLPQLDHFPTCSKAPKQFQDSMKGITFFAATASVASAASCNNSTQFQTAQAKVISSDCLSYMGWDRMDVVSKFTSRFGDVPWACFSFDCRNDLDNAVAAYPSCDEAQPFVKALNAIKHRCATLTFPFNKPDCTAADLEKVTTLYNQVQTNCNAYSAIPNTAATLGGFLNSWNVNEMLAYFGTTGSNACTRDLSTMIGLLPDCLTNKYASRELYYNIRDDATNIFTSVSSAAVGSLPASIANLATCATKVGALYAKQLSTECKTAAYLSDFQSLSVNPSFEHFAGFCSNQICQSDLTWIAASVPALDCAADFASSIKVVQTICTVYAAAPSNLPTCTASSNSVLDNLFRETPASRACVAVAPNVETIGMVVNPPLHDYKTICASTACVKDAATVVSQLPNCQDSYNTSYPTIGASFQAICKALDITTPGPSTSTTTTTTLAPTTTTTAPNTSTPTPTPTKSSAMALTVEAVLLFMTLGLVVA